jgi:hypothetical protein
MKKQFSTVKKQQKRQAKSQPANKQKDVNETALGRNQPLRQEEKRRASLRES